jgi:uncharacterized RDD family membrane protein YckC
MADAPLDTLAEIETPEHVRFHRRVAGPARRGLAWLIDALLRVAALMVLSLALMIGFAFSPDDLGGVSTGMWLVFLFVLDWGYFVFFEMITSGRSPGKMLLGLRVVSETGHPLQITDSVLRNLLRAADFLPTALQAFGIYALGVMVMGRDRRFRRLGDLVAGTMVVLEEKHVVGEPLYVQPPPSSQELALLPSRLPLSSDDLDAIELYLRRAARLGPARAHELAQIVAPVYARRLGLAAGDPHRFLQVIYHRARGPS